MAKIGIDNVVIGFIEDFKRRNRELLVDTFSNGYCYYFAIILQERFKDYGGDIYYNQIDNHFAYFLNGSIYDVTGDITYQIKDFVPWKLYKMVEPLDSMNVTRNCILKYDTTKEELLEARERRMGKKEECEVPVTEQGDVPLLTDAGKLPF